MKKGCGSSSAPFLFLLVLLYQFQPTYPANFADFIFLANSSTYGENCQKGGLTRFSRNREIPGGGSNSGRARAPGAPSTILRSISVRRSINSSLDGCDGAPS